MVDQLNGTLFPDGPADWLHAPNLRRLAERSARFANAYTASPLCAPARASFMSGLLPSRTRVYDNAAEFASDIPTYAHHLRRAGWRTALSGKMHFVGPDQLHGLEERLTTDIYPADFGWTPDYRRPGERIDWWYHNMGSVTGAGVAEITNQLEYDDDVAHHAKAWLRDAARGADDRPWCLTVSFTHPHDPYVARRRFWNLYEDCAHLEPEVGEMPYEAHDPHSRRLLDANDRENFTVSAEDVRRSRRAYFANVSYVDERIGEILRVLDDTRQEAAVLFVSDHGDMLGERGLWYKMSFLEGSARVPMMLAAPGVAPGRVDAPVSTVDVCATLCDLAGVDLAEIEPWTEGRSLLPVAAGAERGPVAMEYAAEGSYAPLVALRAGRWKYTRCALDPEQLFDLEADPHELRDLAGAADGGLRLDPETDGFDGQVANAQGVMRPQDVGLDGVTFARDPVDLSELADAATALAALRVEADRRWDLARFDAAVRESQARRWVVYEALRRGGYYPWDYQPLRVASERYMRNHMDLNVLEEAKRFPRGE
ncbi:choline-sulfatase [Jannaschia sp. W003]|uniref:choline-sulfatase n=1 Tax=Jannaschia sp. W003 TaxID=2867012 RepID=UPI0021A3683E|nr:choline-sulfatase [Jannaschia sp. W003]UWQ23076.1 choline-sulfatase [Jannaschia sp. W003]